MKYWLQGQHFLILILYFLSIRRSNRIIVIFCYEWVGKTEITIIHKRSVNYEQANETVVKFLRAELKQAVHAVLMKGKK